FLSRIDLGHNDSIGLYIKFVNQSDLSNSTENNISINLFDPEYNPRLEGFHADIYSSFDDSLNSMNYYYLSKRTRMHYQLKYFRVIRHTIKNTALSYVGFRPEYDTQIYDESVLNVISNSLPSISNEGSFVYAIIDITPHRNLL
ncbi:8037_t:CDS:2, partial [Acaulospora morrowiae]